MRHYMFMLFRSSRFFKTIILLSVFIFPFFSATAKELVNPAGALIYHYPEEGRYSLPGESAIYTSLSKKTAVREILENHPNVPAKDFDKLFHLQSKNIEVDKVLDLTQRSTRQLFKVGEKAGKRALTEEDIATKIRRNKEAYQYTHIIGDIAKKKGFKAIQAPSAHGGNNVIIFTELK